MTPDRWRRVKRIFGEARELEAVARAAHLRAECGDDDEVRAEVDRLLGLEGDLGTFLEPPERAERDPLVGRTIGRFRVVRHLASGGMGAVYEAEQESPRRQVALKVIRPGVLGPAVLRRFTLEAELLGRLQHPGIAQILEAGTFDTGEGARPYFAMELVAGRPLLEHAGHAALGTEERIRLLVRACDAVQHAHQKGVIHRDLKPDNIIVDQAGNPKILDFGVARATDVDLLTTTLRTARGEFVGTISYMSPEQLAAERDDLDTRSDLYALGVVGYELLAGRLPYATPTGSFGELSRAIESDDPVPLGSVDRRFRGDLETILTKALEKEKTRRYDSAAAMADDLRRYLAREPISAQAPTRLYQLRKFTARNRVLVGGVAATMLALVVGLVLTSWQAHRAALAAGAAERESARSRRRTKDTHSRGE